MAIPEISRTDVLKAIEQIQSEGVPDNRKSRLYYLGYNGKIFPPKYVVSLAVYYATGQELDPEEFGGGVETNSLLRRLGFTILPYSENAVHRKRVLKRQGLPSETRKRMPSRTSPPPDFSKNIIGPPLIGRIVVQGGPGNSSNAEALLFKSLSNNWPQERHVKFLITPGGFVVVPFPKSYHGGVSWSSKVGDLDELKEIAKNVLKEILSDRILKAAVGKVDVLTLGIDLSNGDFQNHVEFVAVVDLSTRQVFWTGKSYPTSSQERYLFQVVDLKTHLIEISGERLLVFGCHDLNMFSPRGRANQKPGSHRWKRCEDMRALARMHNPTIVLHHPHSTDHPGIWRTAWSGVVREFSSLKAWASGIAFYSYEGSPRSSLEQVLTATHGGLPTIDILAEKQ